VPIDTLDDYIRKEQFNLEFDAETSANANAVIAQADIASKSDPIKRLKFP